MTTMGLPGEAAATRWGRKAKALYEQSYARRYRGSDDDLVRHSDAFARFGQWLAQISHTFHDPIAALDLGCGTGRYFWALENVRELVGIDASAAMLEQARSPVDAARITAQTITLVEGDFLTYAFEPARFDLVYSIGVLAEHVPFDRRIADRVQSWLKPGGRFAFTTVHPRSFSVPQTFKRRIGACLLPLTFGPARQRLRQRWLAEGMYADESYVREILADCGFTIESLMSLVSDAHLHCLCVARKRGSV